MLASYRDETTVRLPATLRPVVQLAAVTAGQWRMIGGGMTGMRPAALDLVALDVAARWLGIDPSPSLLADMRAIEAEALKAMERDP